MNFQQLRILRETIRCKFNVTEVANAIYISQSGVSKQIKEFEEELGSPLFVRRGKRLIGLTELGETVVRMAERALLEAENIRQAATQFAVTDSGRLRIATTHTQARYKLPDIIGRFREAYPSVGLDLQIAGPRDISAQLLEGEADIGIATGAFDNVDNLISFSFYSWTHIAIAPRGHPLQSRERITIEELARYPIITYDTGANGHARISEAFDAANIAPNIVLTAHDADIIKTYVEAKLGIGIITPMAFDANRDTGLVEIDSRNIFAQSTTNIAIRQGRLQRDYVYRFLEQCRPALTEHVIREASADPTLKSAALAD